MFRDEELLMSSYKTLTEAREFLFKTLVDVAIDGEDEVIEHGWNTLQSIDHEIEELRCYFDKRKVEPTRHF